MSCLKKHANWPFACLREVTCAINGESRGSVLPSLPRGRAKRTPSHVLIVVHVGHHKLLQTKKP
jgi:hypothetical protein